MRRDYDCPEDMAHEDRERERGHIKGKHSARLLETGSDLSVIIKLNETRIVCSFRSMEMVTICLTQKSSTPTSCHMTFTQGVQSRVV